MKTGKFKCKQLKGKDVIRKKDTKRPESQFKKTVSKVNIYFSPRDVFLQNSFPKIILN